MKNLWKMYLTRPYARRIYRGYSVGLMSRWEMWNRIYLRFWK